VTASWWSWIIGIRNTDFPATKDMVPLSIVLQLHGSGYARFTAAAFATSTLTPNRLTLVTSRLTIVNRAEGR